MKKVITEELKRQLIEEYLNTGITVNELCKKHNIELLDFYIIKGKERIHKNIAEWKRLNPEKAKAEEKCNKKKDIKKVKKVKIGKTKKKRNTKPCNINFFEDFNNEKAAYWAGFILGDGCLKNNRLDIKLAMVDVNHLELFRSQIEAYENKISVYRKFNNEGNSSLHCGLTLNNQKLLNDLIKNGITPNKSKECSIPMNIPDEMLNHFMRGVFDADGCFYTNIEQNIVSFSVYLTPLKAKAWVCEEISLPSSAEMNRAETIQRSPSREIVAFLIVANRLSNATNVCGTSLLCFGSWIVNPNTPLSGITDGAPDCTFWKILESETGASRFEKMRLELSCPLITYRPSKPCRYFLTML